MTPTVVRATVRLPRIGRALMPALLLAVVAVPPVAASAAQAWRAGAMATFEDVWATIQTTFYDPTFHGVDWVGVRSELAPSVAAADSPEAVRGVIRQMLGRLGQSHFVLLAPDVSEGLPDGPATLPIDFRVLGSDVVLTRLTTDSRTATGESLRPGDVLISVDGRPLPPRSATMDAMPAQRLAVWRRVRQSLRGADGSVASVAIRRAGAVLTLAIPRGREAGDVIELGNLPPVLLQTRAEDAVTPGGRRAGLIRFSVWMPAVDAPVAAAVDRFRRADGLIFDLRGNPGGVAEMMRGIAGHVLDEPAVLGRVAMRDLQLEYRANPRRVTADGRRVTPFSGRVAILVDELTGSASECFTGGLQSLGRARVFGVPSMGQALPAITRALPNGDVLLYAIGDFVTSTGRRLEGVGVVPDEVTPLSIDALARGEDPALAAALRWMDADR